MRRPNPAKMQALCDVFNAAFSEGDEIGVWSGLREGSPRKVKVGEAGAYVMSGHTPVVQVIGGGGCIALSHVEWKGAPLAEKL